MARRATLMLLAAGLLAASPAAASLRSFITDSGAEVGTTYVCGSPTMGMIGTLSLTGAPACTTAGNLTVPALPETATIATFYTTTTYTSAGPVRGNELYVDLTAATPGPVVFELGYGPTRSEFTPLGAVTVNVDWASDSSGHRVDLRAIWGMVPASNYVALRIRKASSPFAGAFSLHNDSSGYPPQSVRGSFYDGAWRVPGTAPLGFPTIQAAITDQTIGGHVFVTAGTYTDPGFVNVSFGGRSVMVVAEEGPDRTIIDCRYGAWAFNFSSGVTSAGGLEGFTIKRANSSSVVIQGSAYPVIRNCVFLDNDGATNNGGAIRLFALGNMGEGTLVEGCRFVGNRTSSMAAPNSGGAIAVSAAISPTAVLTVRGSTFLRNAAAGKGGAVYVDAAHANVRILDSTFIANNAQEGGALHADADGAVLVERCRFYRNYAEAAGAVYSRRVALISSVFVQNAVSGLAGAVFAVGGTDSAHTVLDYCSLTENFANGTGGVYIWGIATITNSILWGDWHTSPALGDFNKELGLTPGSIVRIGNVNLQGGTAAVVNIGTLSFIDGRAVTDVDPLFAFDDSPHLMPGSPCIDKGIDSPTLPTGMLLTHPTYDAERVPRNLTGGAAGKADLGAYEYHGDAGRPLPIVSPEQVFLSQRQGGPPPDAIVLSIKNASTQILTWAVTAAVETTAPWLVVRPPAEGALTDGTGTVSVVVDSAGLAAGEYRGTISVSANTGEAPAWAADSPRVVEVVLTVNKERTVCESGCDYTSIQSAVNDAASGDDIVVMDGSYPGGITTRGKQLLLRSANGRDATAIDCTKGGARGITVPNGNLKGTVVQGLTIQNCLGSPGASGQMEGGGLWSGPLTYVVVLDSRFQDNILGRGSDPSSETGRTRGGGMRVGWRAHVARSEFLRNDADDGGGLYIRQELEGGLGVEDTTFYGNVGGLGGGLYVFQHETGATTILRSTFESNTSGNGRTGTPAGLGALFRGSKIGVEACTFKNNAYGIPRIGWGGGAYVDAFATVIANSQFLTNRAEYGAGLLAAGGDAWVVNNTFYGNIATREGEPGGGGIYISGTAPSWSRVLNTVATGNSDNPTSTAGDDIYSWNPALVTYSGIGVGWGTTNGNQVASASNFVNAAGGDFRLIPSSTLIDAGTNVNWLFSDIRGSVRAVDGKNAVVPVGAVTSAKFDIGAYEYSRFYGGIGEDATAKAFRDLRIDAPVVATGYEYRIQWDTKDPFPSEVDERVAQAGEYEVRLLLMGTRNNRVVLGTWKMRLGVGYTVPFTFGAEHIGTWKLRLEMVSDIGQYTESDEISIQHKELVSYWIGEKIPPPADARRGERPDVDNEEAVYWSSETNELYAIAPYPVQITWYAGEARTLPILVMAMLKTPVNPVFHVAEGPPVQLLPDGTRFGSVSLLWSDSSASTASGRFTAPQDGWSVLLFRDPVNPKPELREYFTVVRTLTWDHQGRVDVSGDPYNGTLGEHPPVDPLYPVEKTWPIGGLIWDGEHQTENACGGGHVVLEIAPYDGAGDSRAYDRTTRSGQIFAVNEDDPNTEGDDLVVVWYRRQGRVEDGDPGVCWPFKPVRYDPAPPDTSVLCPGTSPGEANCSLIDITTGDGTGPLSPEFFGALDNMILYNQTDRTLPGFNPNEEHAMLFTAQGSSDPGAFPLRTDLNQADWAQPRFTSPPLVLLKYREPGSGEWRFKAFGVTPGSLAATAVAGNEFNPPYPLNQFVFGPCRDTSLPGVLPAGHGGTWTDATLYDGTNPGSAKALRDKDNKLFFIRGDGTVVKSYYFYRLQEGFWFDPNHDDSPERPPGSCVAWLDGYDPVSHTYGATDLVPAPLTYTVDWPVSPTLFVGETLADAKTQQGEPVGLPNVKDQCLVQRLVDQADVRLFDPLREFVSPAGSAVLLVSAIAGLDTEPSPPVGSRVIFKDLPPQLQRRLTYDAVAQKLRLKGAYITDTGEPVLLLNTLSAREVEGIRAALDLAANPRPELEAAIADLKDRGDANLEGKNSIGRWEADFKALSAGNVSGTGYVTLAFNNDPGGRCPAPTMVSVIRVGCPLYTGALKVIESPNPFEEKLTLRHNGDFGGRPDERFFQWKYLQGYSGIPNGPLDTDELWFDFNPANSSPGPTVPDPERTVAGDKFYRGLVDITPLGTGQQLLPDRWFSVRYYYPGTVCADVSPWTPPQLAEGWVKRVMKKINLFDQKVKDFHTTPADTLASMIGLAGRAYEGDVALSDDPAYLNQVGLIELYETLLNRALGLSLDAPSPDASLLQAVLFATTRLNALYMLLGNEAYADAADPTVGFGTKDGQYGAMAPSIFAFQNQADTLLDEELTLLRGRPDAGIRPYYNRFPWNFTIGEGEVAYRQVYNIQDVADATGAREPDGEINEHDAKALFPQGHGDAWGHYTSALKKWYYLVTHPELNQYWQPQTEAILVAQAPVHVDYRDERAFASAAAARARAGADIVSLTYRERYDEDPERQWLGYRDDDPARAWGLAEWGSRAGEGAYIDWAVGNALLPDVAGQPVKYESFTGPGQERYLLGPDFSHGTLVVTVQPAVGAPFVVTPSLTREIFDDEQGRYLTEVVFSPAPVVTGSILFQVTLPAAEGIAKVDRTTVVDLHEIPAQFDAIQAVLDQADAGLNPLGVAKDTVPFDIDPTLVAMGQTHFEQIYSRAAQALQNAVSVFDYANQGSQLLRRQQDSLEDFKRTVADREADFNNRLVEVFGYPYADDCGPGRTYPTAYCETGPDLYHYMYVERSFLMGLGDEEDDDLPDAVREDTFTVTFKNLDATAAGGVASSEVPVTFTIDADRRFGLLKPRAWTSSRKAVGALQLARSDLLQLRGRLERTLKEYDALVAQVGVEAALLSSLEGLNPQELQQIDNTKRDTLKKNENIVDEREADLESRSSAQDAIVYWTALAEAIPKVSGPMAYDFASAGRSALMIVGQWMAREFMSNADRSQVSELEEIQAKELIPAETNREIVRLRGKFAEEQQKVPLQNLVRQEGILRQEIHTVLEAMRQSAARYLNTLAAGERLLAERLRFRKQTAGQVQDHRYTDMTFRVFRNDALQKYQAQFDLAARYVYLAAKAYDYETTLLDASGLAGRAFLADIVKQKSIGTVLAGQPLAGSGLADTMRRLSQNFQVLKPQLGFNNPQKETNRFSLRRELLRIKTDSGSDGTWRAALAGYVKPDLWSLPEFRRYCRPFAAQGVPQPGLAIPFRTTVTSGLNFFGWPLGGGDSYYSAANFATKVRSVGVWFSNYNAVGLAQTPRVYLVPAGEDVLRSPTGGGGDVRTWHVLDQRLPAPELVNTQELPGNRAWIPGVDSVLDEFGAIRRHADFKAFHDSGYLDPQEMTYDTRLIGRSVWNTRWLLIIPGRNLLWDPAEGLETFIYGPEVYGGAGERTGNGISDIKLFFETYAYSGY